MASIYTHNIYDYTVSVQLVLTWIWQVVSLQKGKSTWPTDCTLLCTPVYVVK